jgi:adenylate cyclase
MRLWYLVLAWATFTLSLLLWPTDWWQFHDQPERFAAHSVWRLGLMLLAVGGLLLYRFLPLVRSRPRVWISVGMLAASALGGYSMSRLGGLEEPWFYMAYAIPSLPALVLWPLPQRLMVTALVSLAWVATFFASAPQHIDHDYVQSPTFLLALLILLSTAFGHLLYHLFRLFFFERERLAERTRQLERLDRLKNDLFANVSHELRTPLTLILGSLRTLGRPAADASTHARAVEAGLRNSARLLLLINDLLDLARSDAGQAELHRRRVDVASLARRVVANFRGGIPDGALTAEGLDAPLPAEVDPSQIEKVLYNLLSNALKFTVPEDRQVVVRLSVMGSDGLSLEVSDNGIGIPPDQAERVFDRFVQVEGGANRRFEGTGIGLALVDQVVRAHEGRITLQTEVGVGTTFRVYLPRGSWQGPLEPLAEDEKADELHRLVLSRSEPGPDAAPPDESGERPTVLLVEDNADLRRYLGALLQSRYRVVQAADGPQALERLRAGCPDLVLTDVMMPGMSGFDLLTALRSDPASRAVPVVFLTARADREGRVEALVGGADDYVTKPFDEGELFARIENLLRARAQERELQRLNAALQDANTRLEARVEQQVAELIRSGQLKRFLPPAIAEQILRGEIDPDHHLERLSATVLFADIVGYTALSSRLEPRELARVLDDWVREMTAVVVENEGFVDKFIGDAIMAVFTTEGGDDHAERVTAAARAAGEMRRRLSELNRRWAATGLPGDLRLRIGLHTGPVVLGAFGDERRQTFTVVGTAVNIAARLQHEARPDEILVSDTTRAWLNGLPVVDRGALHLKGLEQPVQTFQIVDPDS